MMTKEQFEALGPWQRGYCVYFCGCRDDEPDVPDESNPYPCASETHRQWADGNFKAMLDAQDADG